MKTNSSAKKRFSVKPSGKVKRAQQGKRHLLNGQPQKNKRNLRKGTYVDKSQEKTIRTMVQG
jgi:large subunit ribosomal protein L35